MGGSWVVHKFGGTSLASSDRYRAAAKIISSHHKKETRSAIVVSAMSKVTDSLIEVVELAKKRDKTYLGKLDLLKDRHLKTLKELVPQAAFDEISKILLSDIKAISEILRSVWIQKNYSDRTLELISGHGEIWSAQFLNAYLKSKKIDSAWLDARDVLIVDPTPTSLTIDWTASQKKTNAWLKNSKSPLLVITGFIASTEEGIATTLKRNGSDYSASIFGSLLKASSITIWTDVDGVLSADPRLVPDAVVLDQLSYEEASELAYFGAKVVHPSTMAPAIREQIPIWIKNTFNPSHPGTKISNTSSKENPVKGFTTIEQMALVNVEGSGMIGVPGIAEKIFGSLREVGVSVVLISQASSEHSICFAVPQTQAPLAKKTIEQTFLAERKAGQIQNIAVASDCCILAIVGDGMVDRPGIAAEFFTALGRARVNIRAIAQGSSERNISVVVNADEAHRALRAVHSAFYLSNQTLSIGVIGAGLIGGTLLRQLAKRVKSLKKERNIDLRVRGILNSKKMLLKEEGLDLDSWEKDLKKSSTSSDMKNFLKHIHVPYLPHTVIIDATASSEMAKNYPDWLKAGIHIVTPNKRGNSGSSEFYREIQNTARSTNRYYLYETTVGAGLPLLHTLRDLIETGDRVEKIEGVLSGTLSYIFNSLSASKLFSQIVKEARAKGYTEPDPRDDLSGTDVARKLVILAREMGVDIELDQIELENLVPKQLRKSSVDQFLSKLSNFDNEMTQLIKKAEKKSEVLRYVGSVDSKGRAEVKLKSYPKTHPFSRISGTDNMIVFTTTRYKKQPMIIQGPGAGPEVTAAGVFSDLLRVASYLGARQ
ncbi:MAG: bifunctional aspartate kinase/homoserine dehydrogenase [Bacteriovoracaceae bacterium]|nr:bifunctional aspartate kinase/homoserine dehydrogenase [Bacteriovoracaceae bacterium]